MVFSVLQLTATLLTLVSAYFISKANLSLSAKAIAELARSKFRANLALVKSFAIQNGDNWAGVTALVISLVGQLITIFFPHDEIFMINFPVVVVSLSITALIALLLGKYSVMRSKRLVQDAEMIIKAGSQINHETVE